MPRKARDITDAELAVLRQLWDAGPATVRGITEALYAKTCPSELATVQKLLGRLESKGCVRRDRHQWPHRFLAQVKREDLITRRLQALADELYGGSLTELLQNVLSNGAPIDRAALRKTLDREPAA